MIPFVNKAPIDQQKGDIVSPMANLNLKEEKGERSKVTAAKSTPLESTPITTDKAAEKPAEKSRSPGRLGKPAAAGNASRRRGKQRKSKK